MSLLFTHDYSSLLVLRITKPVLNESFQNLLFVFLIIPHT